MRAVDQSTFRAFRHIYHPKNIYINFMRRKKKELLDMLIKSSAATQIDDLIEKYVAEITLALEAANENPQNNILKSYNLIRKPFDLYIEHIVSMCKDLDNYRENLIPLLYLPLDKKIIALPLLFTDIELRRTGLKRTKNHTDGFTKIENRADYIYLQNRADERAAEISRIIDKPFYKLYFDMLWNNRYKKFGNNLFQTNL